MGHSIYLNADFDLGLRPRAGRLRAGPQARQVAELTTQGLLGGQEGDTALLQVEVPDAFVDHLGACGMAVPRRMRLPELDPQSSFEPFGWSDEAMALNRRHARPEDHPDGDCLRRVNARGFAAELEARLDPQTPQSFVLESVEELERTLARAPSGSPWIVKTEFGNSGLGNRRIEAPELSPVDRRFVADRLVEDDRLLLEPWLPRTRDWCMVFSVPFDHASWRAHEIVNTRDGALIGALFEREPADLAPWRAQLLEAARGIAEALGDAGYFGPACVDAFVWRDGIRPRLRACVDINARRAMSDGAYRIWAGSAGDGALYYRFYNRKKLALPDDPNRLLAQLGADRFNPKHGAGVVLAAPLEIEHDGRTRRPAKLAVLLAGASRQAALELDLRFRRRFET